jgi:hypothetical protein
LIHGEKFVFKHVVSPLGVLFAVVVLDVNKATVGNQESAPVLYKGIAVD